MRYFIELSYNGKYYHGWQIQPNAITVQSVLEDALSKLLGASISVVGAGRTDAGVHARQMFAHFDAETFDIDILTYKLNAFLPESIAVHNIYKVTDDAHARFDALSRSYTYTIVLQKNAFNYEHTYYFKKHLDIVKMNDACKLLFEYDNFKCFSRTHTDVKTYICKLMHAKWEQNQTSLTFDIKADRFLRNMVRAIVGTMINVGLGKTSLDDLHSIIKSKDRSKAGASVPAHGLFLTQIEYPKHLFK